MADGQGFGVCRIERLSPALDAGQQANHVPADGSKGSLVVVVDVKIDKPVVTLVAAKILEMQVASDSVGARPPHLNPAQGIRIEPSSPDPSPTK